MSEGLPPSPELSDAYARLRRIAQRLLADERKGHTLSATDVVHEALSKLLAAGWQPSKGQGENDVEFIHHAARAMTEVLIDHSRRYNAAKRGGGRRKLRLEDLNDIEAALKKESFDWEAIDLALSDLKRIDARRHSVVVLRFFGGLDNRQIAKQLGVDERTVGRDWSAARLWLKEKLTSSESA
jgi:RNA polymerase sigma factor (TIGR02999 family)